MKNVYYTANLNDPELFNMLKEAGIPYDKPVEDSSPVADFIKSWILPALVIYFMAMLLLRNLFKKMPGCGVFCILQIHYRRNR